MRVNGANLPLRPLGGERVGVRWGSTAAPSFPHLTLTLSAPEGGEGKSDHA